MVLSANGVIDRHTDVQLAAGKGPGKLGPCIEVAKLSKDVRDGVVVVRRIWIAHRPLAGWHTIALEVLRLITTTCGSTLGKSGWERPE